ncbi:MAG: long-chain fatty acid--CoA ligase [Deltaproteobacteria bacterium]|nr:long-chain fatty acid--CoA ligase [Deltaproteobacteria bacterium]
MQFVPKFLTIVDLFEESVAKFAERPLFGTKTQGEWQWITYGTFKERVDAFRGGLRSLGVGKGDRVAAISNNRVEWAIASFATVGLGAVYVPMYEAQLDKDWEFILRDSDARVLIASTDEIYRRTKDFPSIVPSLKNVLSMEAKSSEPHSFSHLMEIGKDQGGGPGQPATSDTAFLIYTSGTTGQPKGVILSHENVASNVSAIHQVFDLVRDDRSLSFLPWAHSFGLTCELHTLLSMGASMGLNSAVDKLIDELSEVQPTVLISVPRIFNRIYDGVQNQMSQKPAPIRSLFHAGMRAAAKRRDGKPLSIGERVTLATADKIVFGKIRKKFGGRLRYALSGGAALAREVGEFIDNLGIMVYEGYGLTETSPVTNVNYPGNRKMGSVGKALPGCKIVIDRGVTQDPTQGEIVVYGPNVMQGYHKRAEETAAVLMSDRGFRTGDMGYLDDDGYLFVTGRIKEQYKLENGKYVVPSPLEEGLKLSPFVANAFIFGDNRPHNVALIVPDVTVLTRWAKSQGLDSSEPEELIKNAKVIDKVREELEQVSKGFKGYERVQKFSLILEDFTTANGMLTPSLKLKRRAVLAKWSSVLDGLYA